ncbi:mitochondrial distribution and morphology protein 34-like isoform X1, partial [Aphis craccivora]
EEDDYQWWTEEDLWKFPPPPPRPPFLEPPYPDGLTTCDLCTWALQPLDGTDNGECFKRPLCRSLYYFNVLLFCFNRGVCCVYKYII